VAELTRDETRYYHLSDIEEYPVAAGVTIYEGAAVGENGSGYARPLVAGDQFLGFASKRAANVAGVAGAERIQLKTSGTVRLNLTGVNGGSNNRAVVYASDDNTFTLMALGNSRVGVVSRWDGNIALVRFSNFESSDDFNVMSIKKTNGITIQDFSTGTAALTASNPGSGATISSVSGGGVKIVQATGSANTTLDFLADSFQMNAETTVNLVVSVKNPNGITYCQIKGTTVASAFASAVNYAAPSFNLLSPPVDGLTGGPINIACTGTELDAGKTGAGLLVVGSFIDKFRLTFSLNAGCEVIVHKLVINPVVMPALPIVFDGTFVTHFTKAFNYMSKKGLKGTVALTINPLGTSATYLTLAMIQEMYDAGWDITNHTMDHRFANRGYGVGPAQLGTVNQIALVQTVGSGAAMTLNGSIGSALFDEPRCLYFTSSGNDNNRLFTIVGLGPNGEAQTETVNGKNAANYVAGNLTWTKVDSITAVSGAGANLTVGVTLSYSEIYADIAPAGEWLRANGFVRGLDVYTSPGGDYNIILEQVLKDLGFRAHRLTTPNMQQPFLTPQPWQIPGSGNGIANGGSATLIAVKDKTIARWSTHTIYLHTIVEDSVSAPDTDEARISDFKLLIDNIAADVKAGNLLCPTLSEFADMCGY